MAAIELIFLLICKMLAWISKILVIFNAYFCTTKLKILHKQICLLENYTRLTYNKVNNNLFKKYDSLQKTDLVLLITVIYLVRKLYDKKFIPITSKNFAVMKYMFKYKISGFHALFSSSTSVYTVFIT